MRVSLHGDVQGAGAAQGVGGISVNITRPFGLSLSTDSAREIVGEAVRGRPADGVALVVTPNIDHIATIRRSPALAGAYRKAARIVCDGWPVQLYARYCGLAVGRVTGCEITSEIMRLAPYPTSQRLYFVVDSEITEAAVAGWAERNGVVAGVTVPPFGFESDPAYCQWLADDIRRHETTLLIMAVGAPRSEVFVDTYREFLPRCWAFCVGQAVKIELGLVRRASPTWRSLGMEWLWRLLQEPARLSRRYATATIGFGIAIIEDQFRHLKEGRS